MSKLKINTNINFDLHDGETICLEYDNGNFPYLKMFIFYGTDGNRKTFRVDLCGDDLAKFENAIKAMRALRSAMNEE